jgi:hypothetical protein
MKKKEYKNTKRRKTQKEAEVELTTGKWKKKVVCKNYCNNIERQCTKKFDSTQMHGKVKINYDKVYKV